ncbi:MAG: hypothetical protein LBR38_02820 [Synergistaceae bacterium]|jgi:hypothetical protein|nr:hypothetical protein [Synergistaceae bacterium]
MFKIMPLIRYIDGTEYPDTPMNRCLCRIAKWLKAREENARLRVEWLKAREDKARLRVEQLKARQEELNARAREHWREFNREFRPVEGWGKWSLKCLLKFGKWTCKAAFWAGIAFLIFVQVVLIIVGLPGALGGLHVGLGFMGLFLF